MEQISVIFISQLGEGWLRPGLSSLYGFSPPSFCFPTMPCASFYAHILRPALWFNMHDKFNSCVHTHYLLDWTPPSQTCSTDRQMPLYGWQESEKATPVLVVINPATAERPQLLHGHTPHAHHNPLSSLFDVPSCPDVLCWAHRHGSLPLWLPTHTTYFTQHSCTPHGHPLTAKDIGYLCW